MLRKIWLPTFLTLLTLINLATVILNRPTPVLAQEGISVQAALGTAFTYQGRLTDGSGPVNGTYNLQVKLFDAAAGGAQIGNTITFDDLAVANGLFTVSLDFGANAFTGQARWLDLQVRPGGVGGAYTTLAPRQPLTAAPYALFSRSTGALTGQPLSGTNPAPGDVLAWNGSQWTPTDLRPTAVFTSGSGLNPSPNLNFIGPTTQVTIGGGQKVVVISSKSLGSNISSGGTNLSLYICYRNITPGSTLQAIGQGLNNMRVPNNTRIPFTLSAVIEGLNGTYTVGMCGFSLNYTSWTDTELGYTTAIVLD